MSEEGNTATVVAQADSASLELRRVIEGAQDALTDEMIARLAQTLSESASLLDQLGRSGIEGAVPVLASMVKNGDLEGVAELVRLIGAARDAITDDMVIRFSAMCSSLLTLLDRLARSEIDGLVASLPRLLGLLDYLEKEDLLADFEYCLKETSSLVQSQQRPATGGLKGLWSIARQAETQEALRVALLLSRRLGLRRAERRNSRRS